MEKKINVFGIILIRYKLNFSLSIKKHPFIKALKLAKKGKKFEGAKVLINELGMSLKETVDFYDTKLK